MYIIINKEKFNIKIAYTKFLKHKYLHKLKNNEGILIPNETKFNTFLQNKNLDIIFLNNLCKIDYIFGNTAKNKIIKVDENKEKTSILVLPKNASKYVRIGDVLTFEFEDII